jgi:hypothetical protein
VNGEGLKVHKNENFFGIDSSVGIGPFISLVSKYEIVVIFIIQ